MSKRHQSSRRKSYGRRQHEVRERIDRTPRLESDGRAWESGGPATGTDGLAFLEPVATRFRLAMHD